MAAKRNHWQVYNSGTQQCYLFKTTAVTVPASCGFRRQICADTNNAFTSLNQQHNMLTECLGSGGGEWEGTILTPTTDITGQMKTNTAEKQIQSSELSQWKHCTNTPTTFNTVLRLHVRKKWKTRVRIFMESGNTSQQGFGNLLTCTVS